MFHRMVGSRKTLRLAMTQGIPEIIKSVMRALRSPMVIPVFFTQLGLIPPCTQEIAPKKSRSQTDT